MATVIKKKRQIGWIIAACVSFALVIVLGTFFVLQKWQTNGFSTSLESLYQRSFYELTDNVNSLDTKLSKVLASSTGEYQRKILKEAATNSSFAEQNMSILPLDTDELVDIHKFFNQVAGYTEYLSNIESTSGITTSQRETITNIKNIVSEITNSLNSISMEIQKGFSIVQNLKKLKDGTTAFSTVIGEIKTQELDFPTMIFDGPFSEAELDKTPVGLPETVVTEEEAKFAVVSLLALEQPFTIESAGKTTGTFTTFNFVIVKDDITKYISVTEKGGKLLTMSGETLGAEENFTLQDAKRIGLEFATKAGIENPEVVWDDEINGDIYLNIAPVVSDAILYPDLVKIKIDLQTGTVIGFEATSYYLNHTERNLPSPSYDVVTARNQISTSFTILSTKLCLAPIDYGEEVLCFEFSAVQGNENYYFFINALTGAEEAIFKVVQANDGTLLS
ncbi:MAG: PepSY1/2 domain-containing protein [Clostridia bacterium]